MRFNITHTKRILPEIKARTLLVYCSKVAPVYIENKVSKSIKHEKEIYSYMPIREHDIYEIIKGSEEFIKKAKKSKRFKQSFCEHHHKILLEIKDMLELHKGAVPDTTDMWDGMATIYDDLIDPSEKFIKSREDRVHNKKCRQREVAEKFNKTYKEK